MRGPKVELVLERATLIKDGGGSQTVKWSTVGTIKGVLTFVRGDERVRDQKESLQITHQFWCSYRKDLSITEKDEFARRGRTERYKVVYPDNILDKLNLLKIDLVQIR